MSDEVNVPLLRKAVEWVEEQDKLPVETRSWVQRAIINSEHDRVHRWNHTPGCGTAYCIAGFVAAEVDERFRVDGVSSGIVYDERSRPVSAVEVASDALGISIRGDHGLFRADNSAARIREVAENLAGERL